MNKIEALIEELCPDGVEFLAINDLTKDKFWIMPATPKFNASENTPYITSKNIRGGNIDFTKVKYISHSDYLDLSRNRPILEGDILISMIGTIGEVARVKKTDLDFYGQNMYLIRLDEKSLNIRYFLHYFDSKDMRNHFNSIKNQSSQGYLKSKDIETVEIPIPPLAIQKEIVKILDNFTELEAELEAELGARKKQYEHYREELLSFGDEVEFRELGEVGKFLRGSAITAKETTAGEIPVVANAPNPTYFHGDSNRTGETIVIARSGAYCGLVSFWNQPIFLTDAFSIYLETTLLKAKFIYYFLKKNQKAIHTMKKGYGVPHVRVKDFESYSVPIPPLSEQKRIVAILDKFDALVNDISTGLPAEIAARKKQYEYYRNQLLTFRPLEKQDVN